MGVIAAGRCLKLAGVTALIDVNNTSKTQHPDLHKQAGYPLRGKLSVKLYNQGKNQTWDSNWQMFRRAAILFTIDIYTAAAVPVVVRRYLGDQLNTSFFLLAELTTSNHDLSCSFQVLRYRYFLDPQTEWCKIVLHRSV